MTRTSFDAVMSMQLVEFFNLMAYRHDKIDYENELMKRWKRTH